MTKRYRYYSDEDPEVGITRSQLRRLGRDKQLAYMRKWFETYYEDPSQNTPREDGEFLYIWGGPYDAHDVLGNEFGRLVSDARCEEAVEMVQEEGTLDWAPTAHHPDRVQSEDDEPDNQQAVGEPDTIEDILRRLKDGYSVRLAMPEELAQREVVRRNIDALQAQLARLRPSGPGIGHNGGPRDQDAFTVAEVEASVVEIKTELDKTEPNAVKVAGATLRLVRFAKWMRARVEKGIEKAVENAMTGIMVGAVAYATGLLPPSVVGAIHQLGQSATHWLSIIIAAF